MLPTDAATQLKISANGAAYSFSYASAGHAWQTLRANEDGTLLSTDVAGGFVGAMVGVYARSEH
jgi:alpha-N-arabinofuranosidase